MGKILNPEGPPMNSYGSYKLIYDDQLNITWLDFTRWGKGIYDTMDRQVTWASELEVDFNGQIIDDWRLPTADAGNVQNSEMGNLYWITLGNHGNGLQNTGPFDNLQPSQTGLTAYVSGTTVNLSDNLKYYVFQFWSGVQTLDSWDNSGLALAVRDGDIVDVVPPPPVLKLTPIMR
jgi:hypothetical protein